MEGAIFELNFDVWTAMLCSSQRNISNCMSKGKPDVRMYSVSAIVSTRVGVSASASVSVCRNGWHGVTFL